MNLPNSYIIFAITNNFVSIKLVYNLKRYIFELLITRCKNNFFRLN